MTRTKTVAKNLWVDVDFVVALSTRQKKEEKILWSQQKPPQNKKKGERKMKNKLLCFGLVLVVVVSMSVISPVHAISLATLKNSLSKFCIASPEACGTSDAPIFDTQKNSCVCYNSNYQQYDASQRKCVIKCPAGTYRFEATTGRCPAGFYIAGATAKCPAGSHQLVVDKRALKSYEFGG